MEQINNIICPVCTLYLRPGITLESHLSSHPKQKVIEALIKVSQLTPQNFEKLLSNGLPSSTEVTSYPQINTNVGAAPSWNQSNVNNMAPNISQVPTNHSFIYQQFMSSSGTQPILNVNPMGQQFVAVPTVINPQMFCSPYVYQQQQQLQIVSTNPNLQQILPRSPLGIVNNEIANTASTNVMTDASTSPVNSTKQIHTSTSTDPEITCENEKNEIGNNEDGVEIIEEDNKNEAIEVYPDMYAGISTVASYDEPHEESHEIILSPNVKHSETVDDAEQTEEIVDNDVEIIESIDISKVDRDIIITSEEVVHMPVLIAKPLNLQWKKKQDDDLDKACQTSQSVNIACNENNKVQTSKECDIEVIHCETEVQSSEPEIEEIYKVTSPSNEVRIDNNIYTISKSENVCLPSSSNVLVGSNQNITLLEIDDMNFMISNDFIQSGKTILSKVENYECIREGDGNKVIMNIGEERSNMESEPQDVKKFCIEKIGEESMSRESLNIHADERMPPRGELSEQESNGEGDIAWGKSYHEQECSSGMSTSYDLLARESWEGSDCSDSEMPPLQSRIPPPSMYIAEKEPDIISPTLKKSPVSFICSTCGESFSCPKERRVHRSKEHGTSSNSGSSKKIIKARQIRKQKAPAIKEENNFEFLTKIEPTVDVTENEIGPPPIKEDSDVPNEVEVKPEQFLCNVCGEMCPSVKEFNKHLHQVHKIINEKHKCKTCLELFPSEAKFTEHLKIHPLECNLCGKNFYRRYNLYIHLKRHYNIRPHKCDICSKAFLTKQKLQEHNNVHTRVAPIKCTMCDETFRRHSNLIQHRNQHHFNIKRKYKDYVCHCGEVFHSKNKLNWHKEIHDTKPKSCTYCHEKFIHMSSLTRHIRRSHNQNYVPKGKKDTENVECHICKGIYFKNSLEVHLQTHSGRRAHACLICGKEFTTKWNLKLHRWTHASRTSKPYKCDQCNGAFIRLADYQAHMNSHKSVRPYTCNYCGCKFIRKYNCQRHVREHEENKSYTCTVCNKSFHRSYYLKEHMRVHSGARPYACHICGKTSTTKSNHNKHMKIHHAREPVSTEG